MSQKHNRVGYVHIAKHYNDDCMGNTAA